MLNFYQKAYELFVKLHIGLVMKEHKLFWICHHFLSFN